MRRRRGPLAKVKLKMPVAVRSPPAEAEPGPGGGPFRRCVSTFAGPFSGALRGRGAVREPGVLLGAAPVPELRALRLRAEPCRAGPGRGAPAAVTSAVTASK